MQITIVQTVTSYPSEFQGNLYAPILWLIGGGVVLLLTLIVGAELKKDDDGHLSSPSSLVVSVMATAVTTGFLYMFIRKELPETILVTLALSSLFALGVAISNRIVEWTVVVIVVISIDLILIAILFSNTYEGMIMLSLVVGIIPFVIGCLSTNR